MPFLWPKHFLLMCPHFTGDSGPILSLTGKQRMEYVIFSGINSDGCNFRGSSKSNYGLPTERLQEHEGIVMKHGDLVSTLDRLINMPY